jgi:hypothetical protein
VASTLWHVVKIYPLTQFAGIRKFGNSFSQTKRSGCVGKRVCRTI